MRAVTDWHDAPPSVRLRALAMRPALAATGGRPVTITEICNEISRIAADVDALERLAAAACEGSKTHD